MKIKISLTMSTILKEDCQKSQKMLNFYWWKKYFILCLLWKFQIKIFTYAGGEHVAFLIKNN